MGSYRDTLPLVLPVLQQFVLTKFLRVGDPESEHPDAHSAIAG